MTPTQDEQLPINHIIELIDTSNSLRDLVFQDSITEQNRSLS